MNSFNNTSNSPTSTAVTLLVVSVVQFLVPFLLSASNVALPAIGRDLNASAVQLSLAVTVLILGNAMFLLPAGRFADIYGRKKIFIAGTVILAIATLAVGLISSIRIFLYLRFLQGIGCAMIIVTSFAILTAVFPPERRGRALGTASSMVATMRVMGMFFSATAIAVILSIYLGDAAVTRDTIPEFVASMQTSLSLFSILCFLGTIFSMVKGRLATTISTKQHR